MSDRFENWEYPDIVEGEPTKYNWIVQGLKDFKLGNKTDIGTFSYIKASHGVEIEDGAQLGSHCAVYSISTIDDRKGKVRLKKNCSIGSHSTIMPGVTIGENSIVGAHSFVNKDIPDNVLAYGVPVKIVTKLEKK